MIKVIITQHQVYLLVRKQQLQKKKKKKLTHKKKPFKEAAPKRPHMVEIKIPGGGKNVMGEKQMRLGLMGENCASDPERR